MDRLLRLVSNEALAVVLAGALFAAAHLPSPVLTAATLVWGIVSCALFRRYRNLWALGLAQGLLGLCFASLHPRRASSSPARWTGIFALPGRSRFREFSKRAGLLAGC